MMNRDNRFSKKWLSLLFILVGSMCYAQTATINWANTHQAIDGFGASDIDMGTGDINIPSQYYPLIFGTSGSDLGLSWVWTAVPADTGSIDVHLAPGDCSSISSNCAGTRLADIQAAASYGARVGAVIMSPPPRYTTNGAVYCTAGSGNGTLISSDYGLFSTWVANFVKSVQANTSPSVTLYAVTTENEPEYCTQYWSAVMSPSQVDTFTKDLGSAISGAGLNTIIDAPYPGRYSNLVSDGQVCMTDSSCASYVGALSSKDYDTWVSISGGNVSVNDTPYPSGWIVVPKYWMTETSCQAGGGGPSYCSASFDPSMTNALAVAAEMDQRIAVDNMGMFDWWWFFVDAGGNNGEGLVSKDTSGNIVVADRAYVMAQYSRFVRPGYYRIDATHVPQPGITVSAYQNLPTGSLVIVATNYTTSNLTQSFNVTNAPAFSSVTPYVTSATQQIQQQAPQSVASGAFTYTLPAGSVTTFVGQSSGVNVPSAPTGLRATVN